MILDVEGMTALNGLRMMAGHIGRGVLAALALMLAVASPNPARASSGELPPADQPVVVELFTSQGCSSCPPAERVLSALGRAKSLRGRVVLLAYHVDSWDRRGWRDPFSSARWTERQENYDRTFGLNGSYTPQAVINGTSQCVGSDQWRVLQRIVDASPPAAEMGLAIEPPEPGAHELRVTLEARLSREARRAQDVAVAIFESGLSTAVHGGENRGATLTNDYVVRSLDHAFNLAPGDHRVRQLALRLDPGWNRSRIGIAAFVQDPATLRIQGAAVKYLGPDQARLQGVEN